LVLYALLASASGGDGVASPRDAGCYQGPTVSDALARPTRLRIIFRNTGTFPINPRRVKLKWHDNSGRERCYALRIVVRHDKGGHLYAVRTVVLPAGATSYLLPVDFLTPLWVHATVYAAAAHQRSATTRATADYPLYD
jgi:hypothetical protein